MTETEILLSEQELIAVAEKIEAEASKVSLGESDRCFHSPEDDAWLVDHYLAVAVLFRQWAWMVRLDPELNYRVGGTEITRIGRQWLAGEED